MDSAGKILRSRAALNGRLPPLRPEPEAEGGCGVTGFISSVPVSGKNIFEPSVQMHNRGNGKGGGVGAVGFVPEALGVSRQILDDDYLVQIALLDGGVAGEIESRYIRPGFRIDQAGMLPTIGDHRSLGLEVRPADIMRYFVRVKDDVLDRFIAKHDLGSLDRREAEDEFVYQNSFQINSHYYASLGEKRAFVMSHGRNMMILKIVGYAENVVRYYQLDDFKAHAWLAHQRYPTRGRVWHPGGCHPFSALHEALVHNGDFANYQAIREYLQQRNYHPLFLTDTEEAALLLDLWSRVYRYPLEYLIEAMAPTSEMDFDLLPAAKQALYRTIQSHHVHASPDGPWFFIIARNDWRARQIQLIGITDTAMLRPQVFALQDGEVQVGLICSEKQAIDATLGSLAREDARFGLIADKYWNARGGSHTDGGAFIFNLREAADGSDAKRLVCTDKFGKVIETSRGRIAGGPGAPIAVSAPGPATGETLRELVAGKEEGAAAERIFESVRNGLRCPDADRLRLDVEAIKNLALADELRWPAAVAGLTLLNDRRYDLGALKRSAALQIVRAGLDAIFLGTPGMAAAAPSRHRRIDFGTRGQLRAPRPEERTLVIDAAGFEAEGDRCDAVVVVQAVKLGWKRLVVFHCRGQRFTGCGCGPATTGVRIDVYGSSGDYLASGIDGMEIHVHGNAQDQLGQIMKDGKLVVFGDVGQTFLYGAKGGSAFVLGNAAGRPLINAVGKPRVVINGTALDYLAESFMAGDPLRGGGFVVLNGIGFSDDDGTIRELESPYPGSNIFSLASGGAIYVRDPHRQLVDEQLNGGEFAPLRQADWQLIQPYLAENERLFGIAVSRLLTVNGAERPPREVYRKIQPKRPVAARPEAGPEDLADVGA